MPTPIFGIRYPAAMGKAKELPADFKNIADDVEKALLAAAIPPVSNPQWVVAATDAARNAYWGNPATEPARLALQNRGALTVRTDKGYIERFYATYNAASNKAGARVPGWYPIEAGAIRGEMARSTAAGNISSTNYTDLSANAFWTPKQLVNLEAYANGWKVPLDGVWKVEYSLATNTTASHMAAITVNAPTANPNNLNFVSTAIGVQSYCVSSVSAEVEANANDVLRLFGLAPGGIASIPWLTIASMSRFSISWLRPRTNS